MLQIHWQGKENVIMVLERATLCHGIVKGALGLAAPITTMA